MRYLLAGLLGAASAIGGLVALAAVVTRVCAENETAHG
jgi:hypothetical protein